MGRYAKLFNGQVGEAASSASVPPAEVAAQTRSSTLEPSPLQRAGSAAAPDAPHRGTDGGQTRLERRSGAAVSAEQTGAAATPSAAASPDARSATAAEGSAADSAAPPVADAQDECELDIDEEEDEEVDKGLRASDGDGCESSLRGDEHGAARQLHTCDVCPHRVFNSAEALRQHALAQHAELFPDYVQLSTVSQKLSSVWGQVTARKTEAIARWGRKVFHIARQRDAGPAKVTEALRAREQLELVVRRWRPEARVFIFGSSVSFGVWDGISDVDFTVVDVEAMEAGLWPPPERNAVRSLTELLRRAGFSYVNLEPIAHARVPIIKHHASAPIRVRDFRALSGAARTAPTPPGTTEPSAQATTASEPSAVTEEEEEEASRREAEDVVARSVRYVLTSPASPQDRMVLEGSVRDAVGADAVQQVWWNRTGEMMCVTCDSTTTAIQAAICGLSFVTPGMRARAQPLHDECRPELYNVDFDLSFRAFGIRNSELLRRYLTSHPCARPGAIVLKDWSKTSGVNNSVNGYLTSYAINIMWIYYLVQKGVVPYVDPINDVPESLVGRTAYGPTYCPMLPPFVKDEPDTPGAGKDEPQSPVRALYEEAGALLLGFFRFYAHEFDWDRHVVSLNRRGVTTKRMLGWDRENAGTPAPAAAAATAAAAAGTGGGGSAGVGGHAPRRGGGTTRYSFCIEDPYEENLNLGRHMGITKTLRVQSELHRGLLSLLKDGEHDSCVFAATDRSEAVAAEAAAADAGDPRGAAVSLPLRTLHRLMAVATREVASARRHSVPGPTEEDLQAVFLRELPRDFRLACKAWNWQQLMHRLGLKLHQGRVIPRREVGVRRLQRHAQPPEGVVSSGTSAAAAKTSLSDSLAAALANGFLRLTPQWVAWSRPWAALHLRGCTFFQQTTEAAAVPTPADPPPTADAAALQAPTEPGGGAGSRGTVGPIRGTPPSSAPWLPAARVAARTPSRSSAALLSAPLWRAARILRRR